MDRHIKYILFAAFTMLFGFYAPAQNKRLINDTIVYKALDSGLELSMVEYKTRNEVVKKRPCVVLLSGGGWNDFSWSQLKDTGGALADLGAAVFVVQYRVSKTHGSTPIDALEDTQDAIKYLRDHSKELKINPKQIIAIGISAGGHLAFASGMSNSRELEDLSSYAPDYIVALSPVIRNDSEGYGYDRIQKDYTWFSPFHVYRDTDVRIPPSLIISGDEDKYISLDDLLEFRALAIQKGDRVGLHVVNNANHGLRHYYDGIFLHTFPAIKGFLKENDIPLFQALLAEPKSFNKSSNTLLYLFLGLIILTGIWLLSKKIRVHD